jgi:hypothetical protein
MDKLMIYINSNSTYNMTLQYGSLVDYVRAVNKLDIAFPVLDRAHPLASNSNTGVLHYVHMFCTVR